MTLTFIQGHKCISNLKDYFLTCNILDNIKAITFKLGMTVGRLMDAIYAHAHSDDLDLDARSQWVRKCTTISALNALSATKQVVSIQLAVQRQAIFFVRDIDFANVYMA